jgi:hypothetical protein
MVSGWSGERSPDGEDERAPSGRAQRVARLDHDSVGAGGARLADDRAGAYVEANPGRQTTKHDRHDEYHAVAASPGVIGHYRLRPPKNTTTVRVEKDRLVKTEGPLANTRESFRALYLLESDDHDSVLELAARIPAARVGGAVEVWPLAER